jgi:hypothetical protein
MRNNAKSVLEWKFRDEGVLDVYASSQEEADPGT